MNDYLGTMYKMLKSFCVFAAVITGVMMVVGIIMMHYSFAPGWVALTGYSGVFSAGSIMGRLLISQTEKLIGDIEE